MTRNIKQSGFSMIELLVVISVFSILVVLATQSIALTLKGSRKSESIIKVREDVGYAINIMERLIRGARKIDCSGTPSTINYTDGFGNPASFSCQEVVVSGKTIGYIASSSARLTSEQTDIDCSLGVFICPPVGNAPPSVQVSITAEDVEAAGIEGAQITIETKILLRVY